MYVDLRPGDPGRPELTKSSSSVLIISSSVFDSDIFLKNVSLFFSRIFYLVAYLISIQILVLNFSL